MTDSEHRGARGPFDMWFATLRIILFALILGVLLFTAVVVYLTVGADVGLTRDPGVFGDSTVLAVVFVAALAVQLFVAPMVGRLIPTPTRDRQSFQTSLILTAAMREGPGLLGLALCYLGDRPGWAVAFGVGATATLLLGWPRREDALAADRRENRRP